MTDSMCTRGKFLKVNLRDLHLESIDEVSQSGNVQQDEGLNDCDFAYEDCHDLTYLREMSEVSIMCCLKKRFTIGLIYTQMRNHLISFNPGYPIPMLYSTENMEKVDQLGAHIFKIGKLALDNIFCRSSRGECVIISGESGSGKTECCKHLLHYIINSNIQENRISDDRARGIERRLLEASPVLEAFGNAPTCYNRNSSRFGKFIELLYHHQNHGLLGGRIQTYLLEKTRILHLRSAKSKPFHVFNAISTMNAADRKRFHLETVKHYEGDDDIPFITWDSLSKSMDTLGICVENRNRITAVLTSLIMLSLLKFKHDVQESHTNQSHQNTRLVPHGPEDNLRLNRISELLGINHKQLFVRLTEHKFSSRRESVYVRPCSLDETMTRIDTLMKTLYQLLFEWIVKEANKSIAAVTDSESSGHSNEDIILGMLDMYGFECLPRNGLEQLCINYANERLQMYFVDSFLRGTKLEYEEEEVPFNAGDLDLTSEGPQVNTFLELNLFPLLEEECRMQRAGTTAARLATRLQTEVLPKFPTILTLSSSQMADMCVRHYAGSVNYDLSNFLDQNADRVPADLFALLAESQLGRWLLGNKAVTDVSAFVNGHRRRPAVCTQFRDSVARLLRRLDSSSGTHFVRCIKPCARAGLSVMMDPHCDFDTDLVLKQLHSCGILDTVRVCRAAVHPVRIRYEDFHRRYSCLFTSIGTRQRRRAPSVSVRPSSPTFFVDLDKGFREQRRLPSTPPRSNNRSVRRRTGASEIEHLRRLCAAIVQCCLTSSESIQADQFGLHRIFLTRVQSDVLETARLAIRQHAACVIQAKVRAWSLRSRFLRLRVAVAIIQRSIRRWLLTRQRLRSIHRENVRNRSAKVIQRFLRRWIVEKRKNEAQQKEVSEVPPLAIDAREVNVEVSSQESVRQGDREDTQKDHAVKMIVKEIDNFKNVQLDSRGTTQTLCDKLRLSSNYFRREGIISLRFIPESHMMRWSSNGSSRCHRLLPYSDFRPLYYGSTVVAGYRLSVSNCL